MESASNEAHWVRPATLEQIDEVCAAAVKLCDQEKIHPKDRFAVEMLLREALTNAVVHGCEQNASRSVSCRLKLDSLEAVIEVSDPGPGFNWRSRLGRPAQNDLSEGGRGLEIYALYAAAVAFNETGNAVTLKRSLRKGRKMAENKIFRQGSEVVYLPGGDLVASTVPAMRSELKQVVRDGTAVLVIDLSKAHIVDSAGIGCLVATHNSLVKQGGRLEVRQASEDLYELFHSMRLDRHFTITRVAGEKEAG